jgi:glycosyltransferase involved in cell wall biosynthesis
MSPPLITVAIPVLNGAAELERLLSVVRGQSIDAEVEIVVSDSESTDRSADVARAHGATVHDVRRSSFSHGGTRNLLMERSNGDLVAFLTQDALPAGTGWLHALTSPFGLADDVGLAFGPGLPRPEASLTVRRELTRYFGSLSPDGGPRILRRADGVTLNSSSSTYFHSVNACLSRAAWREVPFRVIPYAEDRMLALDMLRAGWAKAFVPAAAVVHSHDYPPLDLFRRSFDEWRGLREVIGHREMYGITASARWIAGQVRADLEFAAAEGMGPVRRATALPASLRHACLRHAGAVLGSRAARLSPGLRRRCSLERRGSFEPQT